MESQYQRRNFYTIFSVHYLIFFKSEEELRTLWSDPATRKALLEKLSEAGYGKEELDQEKLPKLLELKYHAISDAAEILGGVENSNPKDRNKKFKD